MCRTKTRECSCCVTFNTRRAYNCLAQVESVPGPSLLFISAGADWVAFLSSKAVRFSFDFIAGFYVPPITERKWLYRVVFLETIAGVPGMVAGPLIVSGHAYPPYQPSLCLELHPLAVRRKPNAQNPFSLTPPNCRNCFPSLLLLSPSCGSRCSAINHFKERWFDQAQARAP